MSLTEFSSVMKARLKFLSDEKLSGELQAWTKSLEASYSSDIGIKSNTKEALKNAASLLLLDRQGSYGAISKFRQKGGNVSNNIFVVTEENLKTQFKYYNLALPTVAGKTVEPGSDYYVDSSTEDIDITKPLGLIVAYITWVNNYTKAKKIEYYTETTKTISKYKALKSVENIIAIRQYGKSHVSTSKQMYEFLKKCGLNIPFEKYAEDWQIGHIEAQSHGRLIITKEAKNSNKYDNGLIDKLISLHRYLDLASSSLQPEYTKLTADILKSFKGNNIFMNVEMQPTGTGPKNKRDPLSNQGSGDLSRALGFVSILKDIGSSSEGKEEGDIRKITTDIDNVAKKLNQLYKNYNRNKETVAKALSNFKSIPADFLVNLESSDTIRTFIKNSLISSIDPKAEKLASVTVNHKKVPVKTIDTSDSKKLQQEISKLSSSIKTSLQKLKSAKDKPAIKGPAAKFSLPQIRDVKGQFYSIALLQTLINENLQNVISANMGDGNRRDILNYRTGRFAASVAVERMSQSREGMITAFYNYMKYPYQTFEPGYVQGSPKTRDPKLLIAKSIREIAATKVGNRLRAVSV